MNNLIRRALSGAVFIAVIIGSILWHPYAYAGVSLVIIVWALLEFYDIVKIDRVYANKFIGVLSSILIFLICFLYAQRQEMVSGDVFLVFIPLIVILFINELYSKSTNAIRSIGYTLTGVVYIALPFSLLNGLVFPNSEQYIPDVSQHIDISHLTDIVSDTEKRYESGILLGFFILLWTNDTFAYLTGMAFGKHRLFERISPKKSWEGFIGGLICTVACSLLIARFFPVLPYYHWMAVATVTVIFGVYGDLTESLLKRNLQIKDSGHFLPGHGGILDRFDSALLAAPVVFFYLKVFVF